MITTYDSEKKTYLRDLWEKIVQHCAQTNDPKKLVSFLTKCGILWIEERTATVYIGVPNEFVHSQVKKFLLKPLQVSLEEVYNPQYKISLMLYEPLQNGKHDLIVDLKKTLSLKETAAGEIVLDGKTKKQLGDHIGNLFDAKFTFENYIVWDNNSLAFNAAQAVAKKPGIVYNPLFIYGWVGLGKTHLMQAIGNEIMKEHPEKVVTYLPTSKFLDEVIEAIKKNKMSDLMRKLDNVDVIMIDDIQFLAEKEKTQEIFHNIFNDFHSKKKQIILTSDRPPRELKLLEERLRTRFAYGVVYDIQAPKFETRVAILKTKCATKWCDLSDEALTMIAQAITTNVRELEWAINILVSKQTLMGKELDTEDVRSCLKTLGYTLDDTGRVNNASTQPINNRSVSHFATIVEKVATYYNIGASDIKGDSRKKEISQARQMLMFIAKKYFDRTLEKIGDYFGGRNHATVIYASDTFEKQLRHDKQLENDLLMMIEGL
jgi:chromosomal replication initiator protein